MTCRTQAGAPETPVKADGGGLRFSEGKPPINLLDPDFLTALATEMERIGLTAADLALVPVNPLAQLIEHYAKGARKYAPRNWERGMKWSRCFNSLMRHALAWQKGEDRDPDPMTGSHHMTAVAWNAFALLTYHTRAIGNDDRPNRVAEPNRIYPVPPGVDLSVYPRGFWRGAAQKYETDKEQIIGPDPRRLAPTNCSCSQPMES